MKKVTLQTKYLQYPVDTELTFVDDSEADRLISEGIAKEVEVNSQKVGGTNQKASNDNSFHSIPQELKQLRQWITWKLELKSGGIYTKRPYRAGLPQIPRNRASVTDSTHFSDFETAWKSFDNKSGGIGFVFTKEDPYFFVDLDKCVDKKTDVIESWVLNIIEKLQSYTERSQSYTDPEKDKYGLHIITKAELPEGAGNRKGNFEIYTQGRYCAMTGNVLKGYPVTIEERQEEVNQICSEIFKKPEPKPAAQGPGASTSVLSDQEIRERAKNDDKFNRLMAGQWEGGEYPSQSEADVALCCKIAYYSEGNYENIDSLFRKSALFNTVDRKGSERHIEDYIKRTINKALKLTTTYYTPGEKSNQSQQTKAEPVEPSGSVNQKSEDKPIKPLNLTDYGNAERLVYYHGEIIRYCEPMKSWFIWDGKRWKPDDSLAIERLAKDTVRQIHKEVDLFRGLSDDKYKEKSKEIFSHAGKSESNSRIQAMVALARSESDVIIRPDSLDRDGFLLNCENGTIDLKTGELLPHRKEDNITKIIPVSYDRMAEYPKWERFLNEIFSGDQELIRFIKYSVGYSLTTSINEQCFFICYGTGANGKSVFLDTIEFILGEYGKRVNPITFEDIYKNSGPREDIAGLKQIRYISTIETGQGRRLAENLLKQMTGDSTIRARFLYQNSFEFDQTYKIWIATNYKPGIRGTDEGIWRRVRLIPFEFTIEPEKQNKNLREELREEAPGILQWAVEGCLTWLSAGLHCVTPERVKSATDTYRQEMNTIKAFMTECCVLGYDKQVKVTDLHNAYSEWSGDRVSRNEFSRKIEDLGYKKEKLPAGIFWIGVGLYNEQTII